MTVKNVVDAGISLFTSSVSATAKQSPKLMRAIRFFRAPTARCDLAIKALAFFKRDVFAVGQANNAHGATTIARLLGHSNIQMSMRYTHASDDSLRSAVEHAATKMPQTLKQPLTRVAVNT